MQCTRCILSYVYGMYVCLCKSALLRRYQRSRIAKNSAPGVRKFAVGRVQIPMQDESFLGVAQLARCTRNQWANGEVYKYAGSFSTILICFIDDF